VNKVLTEISFSVCLALRFPSPNWCLLFQTIFPCISVCLGE